MKVMRVVVATCAVLAAMSGVAQADIIMLGATPADAFTDLGATGFGNFPRLLTLQDNGFEFGSVTPVDTVHDGAISGADKSTTPTLATLGWDSGANVGIGLNIGQTGNTGLTLDTLVLTIYSGTTAVGSFSLASPITFSAADTGLQQGNGNSVFNFGLDAAQQAQFNTLLATYGSSARAGLASSLGCAAGAPATCLPSNDGPDSYLGFSQSAVPGVPDGGLTVTLLGSALVALGVLRRRLRP
jgi:hypothetical protein